MVRFVHLVYSNHFLSLIIGIKFNSIHPKWSGQLSRTKSESRSSPDAESPSSPESESSRTTTGIATASELPSLSLFRPPVLPTPPEEGEARRALARAERFTLPPKEGEVLQNLPSLSLGCSRACSDRFLHTIEGGGVTLRRSLDRVGGGTRGPRQVYRPA